MVLDSNQVLVVVVVGNIMGLQVDAADVVVGYVMAWEVTLEYNNTCFVVVVVVVVNIDGREMSFVAGLVQEVNALRAMP